MKTADLVKALHEADKQGKSLFVRDDFKAMFPKESEDNLTKSLQRHVRNGLLVKVCQGLYQNPMAHSMPSSKLESLVTMLRPNEMNIITGETILSRYSVISQMMFDYLVVMTTGASKKFETEFGTIEFVHTKRNPENIKATSIYDETLDVYVATVEQAYKDLQAMNRNLQLVDMDELADAIEEQKEELNLD